MPDRERSPDPFTGNAKSNHDKIGAIPKSGIDKILTVILVISIIASVVLLVYVIITPKQGEKFTEFYILGMSGKADDYPTDLIPGESGHVIVGVVNHEYSEVHYSLELILDNESLVQNPLPIVLEHNQTWEHEVTFTPTGPGKDMKVRFFLYRDDNFTVPYRDLYLVVNVGEP